jgi:glycosyltransferase involved in cell wall biosynthesis
VAVVPSLYEPFGFVALEAAILGAPLVVSRTGGLAEIVEDGVTGGEFAPGDVDDLADTLLEALEHPRRSRQRAAALESKRQQCQPGLVESRIARIARRQKPPNRANREALYKIAESQIAVNLYYK